MSGTTAKFPYFRDISGWQVLVFGGGHIAERRVGTLLDFGPSICVVSPSLSSSLTEWWRAGEIAWEQARYAPERISDREQIQMVLAATDDPAVNTAIFQICRERGIRVNNASNQEECDFFFPAVVRDGDLILGVTSGGSNHGRVRRVAAALRKLVKKEELR